MVAFRERHWGLIDALVVCALLATILVLPVVCLVPYNDEWLRFNFMDSHSVWEWLVEHARSWVVRPTAELVLGLAALPNVRSAQPTPLSPQLFLARFQAVHYALGAALGCLLYANAAVAAGRLRAMAEFSLLCAWVVLIIALAGELGYAFYWSDGYGNILLPFLLSTLGMLLSTRGPAGQWLSVPCWLLAALGHEIASIFGLGYALAGLLLRGRARGQWARVACSGLTMLLCGAVLYAQLWSGGPQQRAQAYFERTGMRYNLHGAWQALQLIDVPHMLLLYGMVLLLTAAYGSRLAGSLARARADFRAHRAYWVSLALGAACTALLPLASVGLKKPPEKLLDTGGGYCIVHTALFVVLSAVCSYPGVAPLLERALRGYRQRVCTVLPLIAATWLVSRNWAPYREVLVHRTRMREAAERYMTALATARPGARVVLCRPGHEFVKPHSSMSARNAAEYFGLHSVTEYKCQAE